MVAFFLSCMHFPHAFHSVIINSLLGCCEVHLITWEEALDCELEKADDCEWKITRSFAAENKIAS